MAASNGITIFVARMLGFDHSGRRAFKTSTMHFDIILKIEMKTKVRLRFFISPVRRSVIVFVFSAFRPKCVCTRSRVAVPTYKQTQEIQMKKKSN